MAQLGMRIADQETARVVAVRNSTGVVGAGCLLSSTHILTCLHVVADTIGCEMRQVRKGNKVSVQLIGVSEIPTYRAVVEKVGKEEPLRQDLALLRIIPRRGQKLAIPEIEFATPFRHGGKTFSVLGFPQGDEQGLNVRGTLNAIDAYGLVQMNRDLEALHIERGFSGAPVWSPEIGAFVGIVIAGLEGKEVSWCIPSQALCKFHNDLIVKFRIPKSDRPEIHDYWEDDPNSWMFGGLSDNGFRALTATVINNPDDDVDADYKAILVYKCLPGSRPPRGKYVTFVTYPDFTDDDIDAYELFEEVKLTQQEGRKTWIAETWIYPAEGFTVAAIGDAGDTALTCNLSTLSKLPNKFK